jgi:hypothetical protein
MNDDIFARVVAEEVKNRATTQQREYLNLPENWSRWQRALVTLENNLNDQLVRIRTFESERISSYKALGADGIKLIAEASAEFDARRGKIERFKFHVSSRLDEVTQKITGETDAVDKRLEVVDLLRRAIEQHKSMITEFDLEPTAIDFALWSALDGDWQFDGISESDLRSLV